MISTQNNSKLKGFILGVGALSLSGAILLNRHKIHETVNQILRGRQTQVQETRTPSLAQAVLDLTQAKIQEAPSAKEEIEHALTKASLINRPSSPSLQELIEKTSQLFEMIQEPESEFILVESPPIPAPSQDKRTLSFSEYSTKANLAGGNCLFHSVIDSLALDSDHATLRKIIHAHICEQMRIAHPLYADLLLEDGIEIIRDTISEISSVLDELETGIVSHRVLNYITLGENFWLRPLIDQIPGFTRPLKDPSHHRLIEVVKKYFKIRSTPNLESKQDLLQQKNDLEAVITFLKEDLKDILKEMKRNWEKLVSTTPEEEEKVRNGIIQCMLKDLEKTGTFGGQAALQALSEYLNCRIQVFSKSASQYQRRRAFGNQEAPEVNVLLNHSHYEAILPKSLLETHQNTPSSTAIARAIQEINNPNGIAPFVLENMHLSKETAIRNLSNFKEINDPNLKKQILKIIELLGDA